MVKYMLREPIRKPGLHMSEELRDKFLRGPELYGLDLAALIIQTGRDHGINSYASWREYCGLPRPNSFEDLKEIVLESVDVASLSRVYNNVNDTDLFVLGLAEKPAHGALVGPTFACLIAKQFEKTRHGDRFWYENFFEPSAFSEGQLNELRKTTLARIICDNTDDIG
ncbi:Protein C46A5.4 [Aphelenchoides avenae]|nr:Protein C46A5.4 [Aphelenchus avenae]